MKTEYCKNFLMFLPMRRILQEGFIKRILLVMPTKSTMLEEITKKVLLQTRKMSMVVEGRKSFTTDSLWMKVSLITGVSLSSSGSHLQWMKVVTFIGIIPIKPGPDSSEMFVFIYACTVIFYLFTSLSNFSYLTSYNSDNSLALSLWLGTCSKVSSFYVLYLCCYINTNIQMYSNLLCLTRCLIFSEKFHVQLR